MKINNQFVIISLLLLITIAPMSSKVLIFTCAYNRPDFIALQAKTFRAFLQDPDYEYVVFNDGQNGDMAQRNEQICAQLGIRCIRMPQHLHTSNEATFRHNDTMNYAFRTLANDFNGLVVLMDSDVFLIKPLNIQQYMQGYDLIGGHQERNNGQRVIYISPVLVFFNMNTLPNKSSINFSPGRILGNDCDNGAYMYYYLKNNPYIKYRLFMAFGTARLPKDAQALQELGYDQLAIQFILSLGSKYGFEFHGDNHFIHHWAGGCNWPKYSAAYMQEKANVLNNFINESIQLYGK